MNPSPRTKRSPSSYDRWSVCTASPSAITKEVRSGVLQGKQSSSYAEEGQAAHKLFELCMDLGFSPWDFINSEIEYDTDKHYEVDVDMCRHIETSIEYVKLFINDNSIVWCEKELDLDKTLPGEKGTADLFVLNFEDGKWTLHVFDLKYGRGILVNVVDNSQMKLYALGAIDDLLDYEQRKTLDCVVTHVVQPRLHNIARHTYTKGDLERFRVDAHYNHRKTFDPELREFVSGTHCQFCPRKHHCKTLVKSIFYYVMEDPDSRDFEDVKNPEQMSPEELADVFPMLKFISGWANNTLEHMTKKAIQGVQYGDLKVVEGNKSPRTWKDKSIAQKVMMKLGLKEEETFKKVPLTPSQFEDEVTLINKIEPDRKVEYPREKLKKYVNQKHGKLHLVSGDDPRPAYSHVSADELLD